MSLSRAEPLARGRSADFASSRSSATVKARLALEILSAHVHARRSLRRAPIRHVVARLRATAEEGRRSSESSQSTDGSLVDGSPADGSLTEARRLGRAVVRTLALVPGDTRCLARSLVLTRLLARRAIPAKLVIGTSTGPDFTAHAWVEHDGVPVLEPGDETLGRLVEL